MDRIHLFEETLKQYELDYPGTEKDGSADNPSLYGTVEWLLDIERRKRQGGLRLTEEEKEHLDALGSYGRDDIGPGPIGGYVVHILDPSKKMLGELLCGVAMEAEEMRRELLGGRRRP